MITRLCIRNYRSHKQSDFTLEPLTVFAGPVASGKSNVFKALDLLHSTVARNTKEYFGPGHVGFRYERTGGSSTDAFIEIEVEVSGLRAFAGDCAYYKIAIGQRSEEIYIAREVLKRVRGRNGGTPSTEVLFDAQGPDRQNLGGDFGGSLPKSQSVLSDCHPFHIVEKRPSSENVRFAMDLAWWLYCWEHYHLEVISVRSPSAKSSHDRIEHHGGGIPSFLLGLRDRPDRRHLYQNIENDLKGILGPRFEGIRLIPAEEGRMTHALEFKDYREPFLPFELSDGTLVVLALSCIANEPARRIPGPWGEECLPRGIVCIEEPENHIHPRVLQWLFDKLVGMAYPSDDQESAQVLISTHSPYLVDLFKDRPSAIRIVQADENGFSSVRSLSEQEIVPDVALGEQWYMGLLGGV